MAATIVSGIIGSRAAKKAAGAQVKAGKRSIKSQRAGLKLQREGLKFQKETAKQARLDALPWAQSGAQAMYKYMDELGIQHSLGIRKIAINDGTAHGGTPLPDGTVADVSIAFDVLQMATRVGRQYGWAGSVQHGASTLPDDAFRLFVENNAVEVHLATGFQNLQYEGQGGFFSVAGLQGRVEGYLGENFAGERS